MSIFQDDKSTIHALTKAPMRLGLKILLFFVLVFGFWAVFAPLDSAAIAPGKVIFSLNTKRIQHLEGGIIFQLLVQEGKRVQKGDVLIFLDKTSADANLGVLNQQKWALEAKRDRLIAERELLSVFEIPTTNFRDKLASYEGEHSFFNTRLKLRMDHEDILSQKVNQLNDELQGLIVQRKSVKDQLKLSREYYFNAKKLNKKGFVSKLELNEANRRYSELEGRYGELNSEISKVKKAIIESKLEVNEYSSTFINDVVAELQEVQTQLASVSEKTKAASNVLDRTVIRASQDGIIKGLNYHAIGEVIAPGSVICEIVPDSGELVIEAKVSPQDIDIVVPGMAARVRLSAYRAKKVPLLNGKVIYVSADSFTDQKNGYSFFNARIKIPDNELQRVENVSLYPGMPAETYLISGSRTFIAYLFSPISDVMHGAFKDE